MVGETSGTIGAEGWKISKVRWHVTQDNEQAKKKSLEAHICRREHQESATGVQNVQDMSQDVPVLHPREVVRFRPFHALSRDLPQNHRFRCGKAALYSWSGNNTMSTIIFSLHRWKLMGIGGNTLELNLLQFLPLGCPITSPCTLATTRTLIFKTAK